MDPIANVDRLVLLLRQRLQERSKLSSQKRAAGKQEATQNAPAEAVGLQALQAVEGMDEHVLRRAFIQSLLTEQFGSALMNDAQFQQIVTRVTDIMEEDPAASGLLSRALTGILPR